MAIAPGTAVVFDVNVYLDYILGDDGSWPLLPDVPPTTSHLSADAVSLAFASKFSLFTSPRILRKVARVMAEVGQPRETIDEYISLIVDMCEFSSGAVIEPDAHDHGVIVDEDNLIVSLAKDPAVDAMIIISFDKGLLDLGPAWTGRLIMRPFDFVQRAVGQPNNLPLANYPLRGQDRRLPGRAF